jgi:murein DD-endopeptidase MepM/ murein hydrolase activator NlpD
VPVLEAGPRVATLDGDQTRNARVIVQVATQLAASHGMDADHARLAAVIGLMTALQESSLHIIGYGDAAGPDSRGLFQQRDPWGPLSERMDAQGSARMFYDGGHGGQSGLFDISGWATMPKWAAAQAVQVSAFPTAYAKWERTAEAAVAALLGGPVPGARQVAQVVPAAAPSAAPSGSLDLGPGACSAQPAAASAPASAKGWVLPLPPGTFTPTSPFGWRVHPIIHEWRLHTGEDLGSAQGTPVFAVADGEVVAAGPNAGYGNQVVVQHAGGVQSAYNHLSAILVRVGARVSAGQLVGRVGSTGMSTAPHLHFEIRLNGQPIDPVPFMRARRVELVKKTG